MESKKENGGKRENNSKNSETSFANQFNQVEGYMLNKNEKLR